MTSVLRHRYGRALGACALSVALLSGGTAGAYAAGIKPSPSPSNSAAKASITLTANKTSVKAGETVKFTGRTTGLKINSPLVLQREKNGKWVPMKATGKVKQGSSYAILATFKTAGTETLRVSSATMGGKVHSPTVTVKVS
ncbi:hypothetical protein AV521_27160 [Streptomyces sp. IMTB 2501]|uniref:hypothetical protein n=1 Tax=Streptomyces sp. IMTB 2501 TaxID=1776340 RepID=UPI00096E0F20|nr:hypothetical protein [Streptomyces sp. IMTB 2501]OLZ66576.1 hypothetical protein AV521_27160 [Streptomyces sp. IMTB 2501]